MMIRLRLIIVATLSLSLWWVADGVNFLLNGLYFGRSFGEDGDSLYGFVDKQGSVYGYPLWADVARELGLEPGLFAPFFIGWAILGIVALVLFLQARIVGWAFLVTFAVGIGLRCDVGSIFAFGLLVALVWPGTLSAVVRSGSKRAVTS